MDRVIKGSIIHGTLRVQDLIPSFLDALSFLDRERYNKVLGSLESAPIGVVIYTDGAMSGIDACDNDPWWDSDEANDFLNGKLFDVLNEVAPPGTYFSAHERDGSDFGFWNVVVMEGGR